MSNLAVMQVIRTELKTVGEGVSGDPVHRHTQYWSMDGELLVETCDVPECDRQTGEMQ